MSYDLDGHKLAYHPHRLSAWKSYPFSVRPLTLELSPTSACNQRCVFCAFDYVKGKHMEPDLLRKIVSELIADDGEGRGIVMGGEGEPTLHPCFQEVCLRFRMTQNNRLGIITNGTIAINPEVMKGATWIRVSINAFDVKEYSQIHGTEPNVRTTVLRHIDDMVKYRDAHNLSVTIGAQTLALQENNVMAVGEAMKQLGVDYWVVKPYSRHPQSNHESLHFISAERSQLLRNQVEALSSEGFTAVFRDTAFSCTAESAKPYRACWAAPFFHIIDHKGTVYPCAQFVGSETRIGDFRVQSYREIMRSDQRESVIKKLLTPGACNSCRHPCRLDAANRFLQRMKDSTEHDLFV